MNCINNGELDVYIFADTAKFQGIISILQWLNLAAYIFFYGI
jgi:hypothetical protein